MTYFILYWEFFKTGLFALGGGLTTLPFLYEMAQRYTWLDAALLPDMIAISESTPGPIGINMATYTGYQAGGILGGIIATLGLVTPSIVIILLIAKFLNHLNENSYVKGAFYGLRPAVTALIALAGFEVIKISLLNISHFQLTHQLLDLVNRKALLIFLPLLLVTQKSKRHPIFFILCGGILGIIFKL